MRIVVPRIAWAVGGIVFFAPVALWLVFERSAPDAGTWALIGSALGIGFAVGIAFPVRGQVHGLRGKVLRFILYALIAFAAFIWFAFIKLSME